MHHSIRNLSSKQLPIIEQHGPARINESSRSQQIEPGQATHHKQPSSPSGHSNQKNITDPAQVQVLSHKLKQLSSEKLSSQSQHLQTSLGETGLSQELRSRSHRSTETNHLKTAIQSGTASVQAFEKLHKKPNLQNLKQLGQSLEKHEKEVEALISDLPGGQQAVESAKKSLQTHVSEQPLVKQLADSPLIGKVVNSVADLKQAYEDIEVCHQKPNARNVAKASLSSTQAAASCTIAVTTGLVALGLVSLPVSAPILVAGAVIGGIAAAFRKWLN